MQRSLFFNDNIIYSRLRNNQNYILLKKDDFYIPIFLKKMYIKLLKSIQLGEFSYDDNDKEMKAVIDNMIRMGLVSYSNKFNNFSFNDIERRNNELARKSYETRTPVLAKMELIYKCNYKCKYCYINGLKCETLSYEKIRIALNKLKSNGVNEIYLTGGEPFLHPNILDIIDYCNEINLITIVQTNGSYINEDICKKLTKYKHLRIDISFHCHNERLFDEFTGVTGAYKKTMQVGNILKNNNINFSFKMCVTNENQQYIKESIRYLEENEIKYKVYDQILPNISDEKNNCKFTFDKEVFKWLYENKYNEFKKSICSACIGKMWISPTGDVYPCELYRNKIGNIVTDSFEELWEGKKSMDVLSSSIFNEPYRCRECDKKQYCNKCLAYLTYKNWSGGISTFCEKAEALKEIYEDNKKEILPLI